MPLQYVNHIDETLTTLVDKTTFNQVTCKIKHSTETDSLK